MSVRIKQLDKTAILVLDGSQLTAEDNQGLPEAFQLLSKGPCTHAIINMENVEFIDSMGMGMFISGRMLLRKRCQFLICGLTDNLETIFSMSRLNMALTVFPTLDDALKSLDQNAIDLEDTQY